MTHSILSTIGDGEIIGTILTIAGILLGLGVIMDTIIIITIMIEILPTAIIITDLGGAIIPTPIIITDRPITDLEIRLVITQEVLDIRQNQIHLPGIR